MRIVQILALFISLAFADASDTKQIETVITKAYIDAYPNISIMTISATPTMLIDEPDSKFAYVELSSINPLKERGQVIAVFKSSKGEQKRRIYRYSIDASIEASRAKTQIAKDQLIEEVNVEPILLRIGSFADMPLSPTKALNQYSKRFIPKGTLIMQRDVGGLADVRKGQSVNLVYVSGAIEAQMETVAMEDGRIGQVISVKAKSGKTLRVRVTGKDTAELE